MCIIHKNNLMCYIHLLYEKTEKSDSFTAPFSFKNEVCSQLQNTFYIFPTYNPPSLGTYANIKTRCCMIHPKCDNFIYTF